MSEFISAMIGAFIGVAVMCCLVVAGREGDEDENS